VAPDRIRVMSLLDPRATGAVSGSAGQRVEIVVRNR